ncbi:DUF4283 domain-containing protein [Cephalotus follicularis]|uniref:DUF4283 domain-containing protein n=1 Tax=Cephalotus follicularis TaxID=3775 RepID=A0A1Q3D8W8_CEPFO|nr:DUF4283 domain-containing protein [Cephalotus follicularis]
MGRPASSPLIPLSQLPDIPKIPINPKSPSSLHGKPLVNLSPQDVKLASLFHAFSLIANFRLQRPPVDLFEHHVNSSWGLNHPATEGLLDPKHILIQLHSAEDSAKAWSKESRIFENRRFLLLRWTPAFTKRKDSSLLATWLRLPGLPLPGQNPAILEVIGNSFGRFLQLDEGMKKLKHPMSPRLCVEMDLAVKLPDEVVIAIGTEEIFHQKIEYDMRISFYFHCHLQGHLESNCRKKQSQATPHLTDASSSSPQGNASILTPNGAVVSAALPAGTLRPRARHPNRTHAPVFKSSIAHTPPACENAPSTNSLHNQALGQAPPDPSLSQTIPSPGLPLSPTQSTPIAIPSDANTPQPEYLPSNSAAPPQFSPLVQTLDSCSES